MGFSQASFAAVNLSVNPVDGSNSLRFESSSSLQAGKVQIHIRVSSTNGDRYQVFQRILEPIVNEKGDALDLQAVETQTLANTNTSGTLYLQNSGYMSMGDQLLYSSSQTGASDAFVIGYSLNQALINTSGNFRGRLIFTVRGMGNASSDQVTIDVFLETASNLKISVKGSRQPNRIRVKDSDTSEKTAEYVNVSFAGNSGGEIRIYQEIETVLQDDKGNELGAGVLQIDPQGATDGIRAEGATPLSPARTLVYSGNKGEDNFLIYFLVDPNQAQQQDAGKYFGRVKYVVETDQGKQEFPIDVECKILPVFTINVTTPPEGVSFPDVLPSSPPQEKEVVVTVLSNLHKPYQVFQNLQTNMTNTQGKEIDNKYFTIQVQIPTGQKGHTDLTDFTPMQTGDYPVFSSDSSGSGATFTVLYRLQGYAQMSPGSFLAPIRFSLNQK